MKSGVNLGEIWGHLVALSQNSTLKKKAPSQNFILKKYKNKIKPSVQNLTVQNRSYHKIQVYKNGLCIKGYYIEYYEGVTYICIKLCHIHCSMKHY